MNVKKLWQAGLAALIAASAVVAVPAFAQGSGGLPPAMMAKIKAWQSWQERHKSLSTLQTMLFQIRAMDKDSGTRLNKSQAKRLLAIYSKWQSKPSMSDDQAKAVSKEIGALLTDKQLKKMTTMKNPFARRGAGRPGGGPGGPGGGRPGGGPGGAGGFQIPDPPKAGYNPMNPNTLPFAQMRPMAKRSQAEFLGQLKKEAKS
jgi:hypothetical protein